MQIITLENIRNHIPLPQIDQTGRIHIDFDGFEKSPKGKKRKDGRPNTKGLKKDQGCIYALHLANENFEYDSNSPIKIGQTTDIKTRRNNYISFIGNNKRDHCELTTKITELLLLNPDAHIYIVIRLLEICPKDKSFLSSREQFYKQQYKHCLLCKPGKRKSK